MCNLVRIKVVVERVCSFEQRGMMDTGGFISIVSQSNMILNHFCDYYDV